MCHPRLLNLHARACDECPRGPNPVFDQNPLLPEPRTPRKGDLSDDSEIHVFSGHLRYHRRSFESITYPRIEMDHVFPSIDEKNIFEPRFFGSLNYFPVFPPFLSCFLRISPISPCFTKNYQNSIFPVFSISAFYIKTTHKPMAFSRIFHQNQPISALFPAVFCS